MLWKRTIVVLAVFVGLGVLSRAGWAAEDRPTSPVKTTEAAAPGQPERPVVREGPPGRSPFGHGPGFGRFGEGRGQRPQGPRPQGPRPQGPGSPPGGPSAGPGRPLGPPSGMGPGKMMPGKMGPPDMPGMRRRGPPSGPPRWPHHNWSDMESNDPEMFELLQQEYELERKQRELAIQYRRAPQAQQPAILKQIEALIEEQFDVRQTRRKLELKRLEEELDRLRDAIDQREEARDLLIKKRAAQLLGTDNIDF